MAATVDSQRVAELNDMWAEKDGEHAWLEEVEGEAALEWVKEQNKAAVEALGDPSGSELYVRVLSILDSKDKIPHVRKIGPWLYNFWKDAENPRGLWRRTTLASYRMVEPEWEVLIDVDALGKEEGVSWVWKGHTLLKEDGKVPTRTLVALSRGGADATVKREYDIEAKAFVEDGFRLPEAKSRVSWQSRDVLLVGTDFGEGSLTDSGYPRLVKEWKRGNPLSDATLVFEGEAADVAVSGYVSRHGGFSYEWRSRATGFYTSKQEVRVATPAADGAWTKLDELPDDATADAFADQMLISLRTAWRGHPGGSLLAASMAEVMKGGGPASAALTVLFGPTERCSLEYYSATRNFLVLVTLDSVKSRLRYWRYEGGRWEDAGSEASAKIRGVSVGPIDSEESDELWVTVSDFLQPSTLALGNAAAGPDAPVEPLKSLPPQFDSKGLTTTQHEAISADGTKIPYFVIGPADLTLDGTTPTLLYGYGGFEVSLTPSYQAVTGAAWLERGGCYVMANIRGGGEFGPDWHQAALKEKRQKAYDDFIAVAEDLVAHGVTSPKRLAIRGGSNGGLLMGNMLVQRPDLFGAVVCAVPLLDMRRYHKLLAGASWMAEYGNPDTSDWETFLKKYSAYHNLDPEAKYPPLLMTTSTRDDRVHPYHARCFVKRLAELGNVEKLLYYENIEGGHGGAADSKQQAFMTCLYIDFLFATIGKDSPRLTPSRM